MTTSQLTSKEDAKRAQIRVGAKRVFLERGLVRTTTEAIAREAKISKQTLYAYYRGKEELLVDVVANMLEESYPQIRDLGAAPVHNASDLNEILTSLTGGMARVLTDPEYLALMRVIIADTANVPGLAGLHRHTVPERALTSVAALLTRARDNGLAVFDSAELAARMFVGPVVTYGLDNLLATPESRYEPSPHDLEQIVNMFLRAIGAVTPESKSDLSRRE